MQQTIKILFWNANRRLKTELAATLVNKLEADVLILLESQEQESEMLAALQNDVSRTFRIPTAMEGRFQVFSRNEAFDLGEAYNGDRISIRRLQHKQCSLLLAMVHVVDKMNWDSTHQTQEVTSLVAELREYETKSQSQKTIVIGDFNMNPFDDAMNLAAGFNAMMTLKCIERGNRVVQGKVHPFFYNPMWGLLGDRTDGPAGTYYHRASSRGMYGWNMLDQVLFRQEALAYLDDVTIVDSVGDLNLGDDRGRPSRKSASDHFPLLLTLK